MKWNIPNILTLLRFALIPLFIYVYLTAETPSQFCIAALILLVSAITDILDGFIARRFHMETEWGKAYDPVADKATQLAVAFCVWRSYPIVVYVFAFFLVKEGLMVLGGIWLYRQFRRIQGSKWFGKLSTVIFYLFTVLIVATGHRLSAQVVMWLMVGVMLFMVFSGIMYLAAYLIVVRQEKQKRD